MERDDEMLRAASMYYLQDLKMEVIARHLGTSRSTVSRLLKQARHSGLVEITLRPSSSRAPGLANWLAKTYRVRPHLVAVADQAPDLDRLDQVAKTAGRLVSSWFDSDMVLGLAWGTTLSAVSRHLQPKATRGAHVVQLNGAANTRTSGVEYASDLISRFAGAFSATVHHFAVPAFFDFPDTKAAMWRERSIRRVLDVQSKTDIAVFGVGALTGPVPSHVYLAGYLDEDDMSGLRADGVVGDICTTLLRADGSWRDIALNNRATGPTPTQLARIPRRVCVAAGDSKAAPLNAALAAGVVTDLVIDELTAAALARYRTGTQANSTSVAR